MIASGLGALGIAIVTWLGFPTAAPIVTGLVMGLGWPDRSARLAAVAGAAGWGTLLVSGLFQGNAIGETSVKLGGALGMPGWTPLLLTLVYPAILAASAAWIGQLLSPRRTRSLNHVSSDRA